MGINTMRLNSVRLSLGGLMPKSADGFAATIATTAVAWGPALALVNQLLAAISLFLGILFLIWRWRRAAKQAAVVGLMTAAAVTAGEEDS